MSIYSNSSTNSFFGLPSREDQLLLEAFHRTPKLLFPETHIQSDPTISGESSTDACMGLTSCTESLGFESSDEISSGKEPPTTSTSMSSSSTPSYVNYNNRRRDKWHSTSEGSEKRRFPPPLTSLSETGRRNFMLKPVRTDGRLEIVGVMIQRPEVLCASRQDGRLRLHLVHQPSFQNDVVESEDVETFEEVEEEGDEVEERGNEGEEERRVVRREALRRCYHRHDVSMWGHQYVTTM